MSVQDRLRLGGLSCCDDWLLVVARQNRAGLAGFSQGSKKPGGRVGARNLGERWRDFLPNSLVHACTIHCL